ncbi:DUF2891 family protein [Candidatus Nitronereus thalassa]|uniref:DUF2891 family protein n=1 Tax=Candidatus Nitronereus thalassa TaxID=3020898 RepID=A0ABU3KDB8_9BACT|nr:DUF2891 family protein [Candidatus Nitronereus thalassa]MDT7044127.1 DUF2891 family protein [Candidatus Nitronereus thalassa]
MISDPHLSPSSTAWENFCASRTEYLTALAITVAQGVTRQDTAHPAFCGCIDWHSCVHGIYALLTVSRLTDDPQWAEIAESRLTPDQLDQELITIQREEVNQELPYGFAWFLKLALERERYSGKPDLRPLATELAQRLEQWIFSLSPERITYHAQHRAYGNLSWALINLWEWSQFQCERDRTANLLQWTKDRLLPLDSIVPQSWDNATDEFFPAALQRTRALLAILPKKESKEWLEAFLNEGEFLQPVEHPSSPHSAGLNFSRSWGLWDLYSHTGKEAYRDQYVNHIVTHMELPQYWRDNYKKHSHWVAQFGIYAIALSFDKPLN